MLSCLCDWCSLKTTCEPSNLHPTTGFLPLPVKGKTGHNGKWLKKWSAPCEAAPLNSSQGVEVEGGSSQQNRIDTADWPEPDKL